MEINKVNIDMKEQASKSTAVVQFIPTDQMTQVSDGTWRYKIGAKDEHGNNIGGNFVKGAPSPNPGGTSRFSKEVITYFQNSSMDAAQFLYRTMMDVDKPLKIRVKCAEEILNRGLGRAPLQFNVVTHNPYELVKPIIISEDMMKLISDNKDDDDND
jgi:hypothetical protein